MATSDLPFLSDDFVGAWACWVLHRTEIKKKLTPTAVKMQFKRLAAMGEARAIAAIEHSIANGYQGIFEPSAGQPGSAAVDRAAIYLMQGAAIPKGEDV